MDWDDRGNAEIWRAAAADAINVALREAGFTQGFVDHRSYARQGKERIPMIHEGPEARAMEQRNIPTEVSKRNREIRAQNKQLEQMEARLARLNAWAQYEKKMDEALLAQGEEVSNLYLRYVLASRIFESTVPPNRKDRRLEDATGLMVIMNDYNITDAASYAEADKQAMQNSTTCAADARKTQNCPAQSVRAYTLMRTGRSISGITARGANCPAARPVLTSGSMSLSCTSTGKRMKR